MAKDLRGHLDALVLAGLHVTHTFSRLGCNLVKVDFFLLSERQFSIAHLTPPVPLTIQWCVLPEPKSEDILLSAHTLHLVVQLLLPLLTVSLHFNLELPWRLGRRYQVYRG